MSSSKQLETISDRPVLPNINDLTDDEAKENVILLMEILKSDQTELYSDALIKIREMIRGHNESPTFSIVPKQILLLQPYYSFFKQLYNQLIQESDQQLTADIISVLSTINSQLDCDSNETTNETLRYKLLGSPDCSLDYFGFEYVNHLTIGIIDEVQSSLSPITESLNKLIDLIVGYFLKSNCVNEAIDFTLEIKSLDKLIGYLDRTFNINQPDDNLDEIISKIGSYLMTCSSYLTGDDNVYVTSFVIKLYLKYKFWIDALIVTLKTDSNQPSTIELILQQCSSSESTRFKPSAIIKQIACILNRQTIYLYNHTDPIVRGLMSSTKSLSLINYTARELDCLNSFNLQSTLPDFLVGSPFGFNWRVRRTPIRTIILHVANGFANIAAGRDELILSVVNSVRPQFLITKFGADCVAPIIASIGLINLWSPDLTLNLTLNRFKLSLGPDLKAGSILACSLSRSGYRGDDEEDDFLDCPEFDSIDSSQATWDEQIASIIGLGVAYSGTNNSEAIYILRRLLRNNKVPLISKGIASLSIGLIAVSSANHKISSHLVSILIHIDSLVNRPESLITCWFICLSIGLIYLQKKDKNINDDNNDDKNLIYQIDKLSSEKLKSMVKLTLNCCKYAGSGDVLQIQRLIHLISGEESFDIQKHDLQLPSTSSSTNNQLNQSPSTSRRKPVRSILKENKENKETAIKGNEKPKVIHKKTVIKENESNRRKINSNLKPTRNIGKGKKITGKGKRKLTHLNEYNTMDEIESSSQSTGKEREPLGLMRSSNEEPIRSPRRLRRYSTFTRRSSLPSMATTVVRDVSSSNFIDSDDESDRPSVGSSGIRPRQTMNLLQSLEALNRSLDQLIAESKGEPNGKVDVTSISFTPPREINKSIAVLGIGLIAMGEDVGMSMAKRVLQQILFNGSPSAKRLVPMAFALLSLSYPDQEILTTLEKYSRYQMISMSINSIIALGLIGSGSLDYKLSKMLDSLFEHYDVGPAFCLDALILTKGLLHLGKGLMTLNPFSYDNQLLFPTGLAAILIIAFCSLDIKHTMLGSKLNQLIYYLTPAVRTRFVVTLDEDTLKPVEIPLGVGQALDTAGQVGKLRLATISSTQNSPIILKDHEKAEIKTNTYKGISKMIEGTVIVTKTDESDS